jgi:hypothetical protein
LTILNPRKKSYSGFSKITEIREMMIVVKKGLSITKARMISRRNPR